MKASRILEVATACLPALQTHVETISGLFNTQIVVVRQERGLAQVRLTAQSEFSLIQAKHYVESVIDGEKAGQEEEREERVLTLPPSIYHTLSNRRSDIAVAASAHVVWDSETCSIVLLGSRDSVHQTALILGQIVSIGRKLIGRGGEKLNNNDNSGTAPPTTTTTQLNNRLMSQEAKTLLMSQLPPELSVSSDWETPGSNSSNNTTTTNFSQFSGLPAFPLGKQLFQNNSPTANSSNRCNSESNRYNHQLHSKVGRTVSDSSNNSIARLLSLDQLKIKNLSEESGGTRRKLEPEDSSYDSDHEWVSATHSVDTCHAGLPAGLAASRSHDDISRCHSETLGQEFAEYVSSSGQPTAAVRHGLLGRTKLGSSRDSSPTLSDSCRLESVQENPAAANNTLTTAAKSAVTTTVNVTPPPGTGEEYDINQILQDPQYNSKVEFSLKLGYTESLTQKALVKIGINAAQNELLDELIRLQHIKAVNPKEQLLREAQELIVANDPGNTILNPTSTSTPSSLLLTTAKNINDSDNLRPIVIDGSNVAMSHGNKEKFSCLGIKICVQWFQTRGHKDITVFVPQWRKESSKPDSPTTGQHILEELEKDRLLTFTPSRQVGGKRVVCLDDRFILNLAAETDAVVVSNDNFRDLINDKPEFKKVIEERILMYSFVTDRFMPPDDPLGRNGPTLDNFLRRAVAPADLPQACPYGKKCTYGNKCKFYHAERGAVPAKSVTEKLKEQSSRRLQEVRTRSTTTTATSRDSSPGTTQDSLSRTHSVSNSVLHRTESAGDVAGYGRVNSGKTPLARTRSSRPGVGSRGVENLMYPDPAPQYHNNKQHHHHPHHTNNSSSHLGKQEISKSKSTDNSCRLRPELRLTASVHSASDWRTGAGGSGIGGLEMGCLNSYGMNTLPPPPGTPWSALVPPPSSSLASQAANSSTVGSTGGGVGVAAGNRVGSPGVNSHRRLERQLTINPSFDPRINKPQFHKPPGHAQHLHVQQQQHQHHHPAASQLLSTEAMEYMHRNPPPPFGLPSLVGTNSGHNSSSNNTDSFHQNVTRISSAPDSIKQWGESGGGGGGSGLLSGGSGVASGSHNLHTTLPVAIVEPLGMDLTLQHHQHPAQHHTTSCSITSTISPIPPPSSTSSSSSSSSSPSAIILMQRTNSTSDSHLNRPLSPLSSFSPNSDTWKFNSSSLGISPIIGAGESLSPSSSSSCLVAGGGGVAGCSSGSVASGLSTSPGGSSIWGPPPAQLLAEQTPPPSPVKSNLGPVGSRPPGTSPAGVVAAEARQQLKYHLSALFPCDQVEEVMQLMPDEENPKNLCAAIMKMFPPT